MAYESIEYEVNDPVAVIRLNRPEKLNALTYPMLAEIRRAVDAATADPAVVGIVITGNGRGFCAGLDSAALVDVTANGRSASDTSTTASEVPGMFTYIYNTPKPVIAAVNGVAAGGGLVLSAMCDVRIASTEARFTTIFLKRGLIAEHGTSWILPRALGPGRALDVLWTSRMIDASEALDIGLVEYLAEPADLLPRATDYVRTIAAEAAPGSVAETKRLVYNHLGLGYPEALRDADKSQWEAIAKPDASEGAKALVERRPPAFARLGGGR